MNITPRQYLLFVYLSYAAALFGMFFAPLIGIAVCVVKRDDFRQEPLLNNQNEYLIRTFLISLAANIIGWVLVLVVVGWLVLGIWWLWLIYRLTKGLIAFNENKMIDAASWL